jgi:microcystin-dependent protein
MSEPFLGEIRMFAGNFAPRGWALCDGQLLNVTQNDALFSLLGTIYGGDGRTTFALPDMRGRIPVHAGNGPGLSSRPIGVGGGSETVTLTTGQLPAHSHALTATNAIGTANNPHGSMFGESPSVDWYVEAAPNQSLAPAMLSDSGGSQPHNNMAPFLCIHFIIALAGIYPSRQ